MSHFRVYDRTPGFSPSQLQTAIALGLVKPLPIKAVRMSNPPSPVKKHSREDSIAMARRANLLLITKKPPSATMMQSAAVIILNGKMIHNRYGDID